MASQYSDQGGGDGGGGREDYSAPSGDSRFTNKTYEQDYTSVHTFLMEYRDPYSFSAKNKYVELLQEVCNRDAITVAIDLDDLSSTDAALVDRVLANAARYVKVFEAACDAIVAALVPTVHVVDDVRDVLQRQRNGQLAATAREEGGDEEEAALGGGAAAGAFPPALTRRFEVRLRPPQADPSLPLRQVKAEHIGRLVRVGGIVTRVSDVKPLVQVATYTCDQCGYEIYQEVGARDAFTPFASCPSEYCVENHLNGKLFLQTRGSKFVKYQEVKLQELPDQVPVGNIPRSLTVQVRGELTRIASPGEMVTVCGIFLPKRYTGFQGMKAGLIADTYCDASDILKHKESYAATVTDEDMQQQIEEAAASPEVLSHLARSIAPEIYGHEDVKKALLLMLVGGCSRHLPDGMRIRGDINVCLMGDPGVAKSQLLKYVSTIAPRGVYTTGKGSSGVGLTAAVVRDKVTGDMSLEGGALVLADKGVCCIDEFDKMDDYDRTAIHEVMEQQTVSIAKAGITTTLNARCAVLAAANPLWGRYNRRKSMAENINLPNSLLSRFDLLFLILDLQDVDADTALARHITYVHQHSVQPELGFEPYSPDFLKHYVAAARQVEPYVPTELSSFIVEAYVELRQKSEPGDQAAMTARALLSILRLSQGLARLRFSHTVDVADVEEAIRITHMSKASLEDAGDGPMGGGGPNGGLGDEKSRVFGVLRDAAVAANATTLSFAAVEAAVLRKGFSQSAFFECLEEYADLNIVAVDAQRTTITFIG